MKKLIFLDTETTGLVGARMIELAYATGSDKKPKCIRVKPPVPIELGAMAVHHIEDIELADCLPFKERADYGQLKELFENNIVIAHHAIFDIGVLERESILVQEFIDTKEIARALYPTAENHKLQYLRHYLGCRVSGLAHSAAGDVQVLQAVWNEMSKVGFDHGRFTRTVSPHMRLPAHELPSVISESKPSLLRTTSKSILE